MFELIALAVAGVAGGWGYVQSRHFVRRRLRFVDAVQKPGAALIAGAAAAAVAAPVVALLPIVGAGTAVAFGVGIGAGVAHGAKDVKHGVTGG
ncbi:MAG TPA: hypothetical protein VNL18_12745 [Gemmatimonadales bacterium]|nr:hypothetical protein [Gemmatimonadales bacterium]